MDEQNYDQDRGYRATHIGFTASVLPQYGVGAQAPAQRVFGPMEQFEVWKGAHGPTLMQRQARADDIVLFLPVRRLGVEP